MIVSCGSCQSRFKVDPARIPAQGARLRCPKCKGVIVVGAGEGRTGLPGGASTAPNDPRRLSPPGAHRASPTAVLVAHGNPAFGEQLRAFLGRHGFATLGATDGASAEALVRERRPPLLLVDAALPGLPGHLLCERLKQDPATSGIKAVLVGAIYDRTRYRRPPQSLYGADGYVEKHQIAEELVPMLRRLAGQGADGPGAAPGAASPDADPVEAREAPGGLSGPQDDSPALAAARRLARIIVSDIVLYNPDAVKRGLAEGNLLELLGDELKEGRSLLKARLGPDASAHDFVLEALREYVQRTSARNAAVAPR